MATTTSRDHPTLLIDIGTASVSGALLTAGKHRMPRLDSVHRVPLGTGTETARDALATHLDSALAELLATFAPHAPSVVRVVLAAPWYEARIKVVNSMSDKPVPVSQKTIVRLVEEYKNKEAPRPGNVDIEALAVQVTVNGYHTRLSNPVSGQRISVNFYESEVDQVTVQKLRDAVLRAFPHVTISFHSFPLVSSVALRALAHEKSFMVLDLAGEVTELAVVYEDGMHFLGSFPIGYHTIARTFGEKGDAVGDALSRLALFGRNELSDDESKTDGERFERAFSPWLEAFETSLKTAANTAPIPARTFLISDREHLGWIRKGLELRNPFSLTVDPVGAPFVQNKLELGEAGTYDIFLSLAGLFFHTYQKELIGE